MCKKRQLRSEVSAMARIMLCGSCFSQVPVPCAIFPGSEVFFVPCTSFWLVTTSNPANHLKLNTHRSKATIEHRILLLQCG